MKQFFKMLLATILGIFISGFLFMFLSFSVIIAIASIGEKEFTPSNNSVFHLRLTGEISERSQNDAYMNLWGGTATIGLDDILSSIKKAKENDKIKGIILDADAVYIGVSSAKEIRDALIDFKESGKFLISYGGAYTQSVYYIASVADQVILNPSGVIELRGLTASSTFYKNALDKLGIEIQLVKVGTYKSFAEQYTNTSMSAENREQVSAYVNSIWNTILNDIAQSRDISKVRLNQYADEMMTFQSAEKTLEYGLVDALMYSDEVNQLLADLTGNASIDDLELITLTNLIAMPETNVSVAKEKIAVVYAIGDIDNTVTNDESRAINSRKLIRTLREVREDDLVKAVVLRVNSPGGSAYGSEQIWREVSLLKKEKPVIVSMGDYAASGGYYISCEADAIVAQPTTLTGSIGIFGIIPNVKGLTEKLGITFDMVKTNEMSDMPAINRPFTEKEKTLMQMYINQGYELFVKRCAEGRNKTTSDIKTIAEGRVWTGKDAMNLGLVDELGGLSTAIDLAKNKAELTDCRIVSYPEKKDFFTRMLESMNSDIQTAMLKKQLGENYRHYEALNSLQHLGTLQTLLPFDIVVE